MLYLTGPARGRPKNNDGPAQPGPKITKKWRAGPWEMKAGRAAIYPALL